HFRAAYDILVRPKASRTALEDQTGTVQPDFLAGLYGGITMAQDGKIRRIPGGQVAAPIALVGDGLLRLLQPGLRPPAGYTRPGRQLYRYATTWVSDGGAIRITQPPSYLYLTPNRIVLQATGASAEVLPGGAKVTVCPGLGYSRRENPFGVAAQSSGWCWSKVDGTAGSFVGGARPGAVATPRRAPPAPVAARPPAPAAKTCPPHPPAAAPPAPR